MIGGILGMIIVYVVFKSIEGAFRWAGSKFEHPENVKKG